MIYPVFNSAITAAILGYIFILLNEMIFFNWKWEILYQGLIAIPIYFIIAAIFTFVLLVPLKPLRLRAPKSLSLLVFVILGFFIPVIFSYYNSFLFSHGENPYIGSERIHAIFVNVTFGVIGVVCSIVAWLTLKNNRYEKVT